MRQIQFSEGSIFRNILRSALPMLAAQIINLLYNIVDRIYIGRIPGEGTDRAELPCARSSGAGAAGPKRKRS